MSITKQSKKKLKRMSHLSHIRLIEWYSTRKKTSVHIALPCVMIGSPLFSPVPSQQSSSMQRQPLRSTFKGKYVPSVNYLFLN